MVVFILFFSKNGKEKCGCKDERKNKNCNNTKEHITFMITRESAEK
jgi:hypothetical protein